MPDLKTPKDEEYYNRVGALNDREASGNSVADQDQKDAFENEFGGDNYNKDAPTSGSEKIKEKEEAGSSDYKNNFKGKDSAYGGKQSKFGRTLSGNNIRALLKRRGPMGLIITVVLGGGIGLSTLGGPGLLIVQLKEVMVGKFNTQLASMEARYHKVFGLKFKPSTPGTCGSTITIRCRLSTLSETQASELDKSGLNVDEAQTGADGRITATEIDADNGSTKITADNFDTEYNSDPSFRADLKESYNPLTEGFNSDDPAWKFTAEKDGISKHPVLDGTEEDDDARQKKLQTDTKEGVKIDDNVDISCAEDGSCKDKDGNTVKDNATGNDLSSGTVDNAVAEGEDITTGADEVSATGEKAGTQALSDVEDAVDGVGETAANTLKVTGWIDNACTVYKSIEALGYAAKTVRAVQLARYAMAFLSLADQIKAGDNPSPETVAYMGGILTEVAYDTTSAVKKTIGAATDSPGYRYAAYGDKTTLGIFSSEFLAGGGLTGNLIDLTTVVRNTIKAGTGVDPNAACGFLANPFVGGASAVVGLATLLIPGADVAFGAADAVKLAAGIGLQVAAAVLPGMLKDIVAGVVADKNTVGARAGEAITSGSGSVLGTLSNAGGNSILTPDQAASYSQLQTSVQNEYSQEDQVALSPFDVTNKNTFLGSIAFSLSPYISDMTSATGILSSVSSLVSGSFGSILSPVTKAADAPTPADFEQCQDQDYRDMNVATDPYCNPIYGIPSEYLDADPIAVLDALGDQNVDPVSGDPVPGSDYAKFVTDCIQRENPIGKTDEAGTNDGTECMINDSNKNYYLAYMDNRVQSGMDGWSSGDSTSSASTDMFYEPTDTTTPSQTADNTSNDIFTNLLNSIKTTTATTLSSVRSESNQQTVSTTTPVINVKKTEGSVLDSLTDTTNNLLLGIIIPKRYVA